MGVLLLGGTAEARELAARLHPHIDIVSSLAGRVPNPALPAGPVRIGGFGGADGLRQWLLDNEITAVIDATHPFAATITAHAAQACGQLGLPYLLLSRPSWDAAGALPASSNAEAADIVADHGYSRVFLTTGRSGVGAFASSAAWFLIRLVTSPDPTGLPPHHELMLSRGPYSYAGERALLTHHRIDVVVTKNSGGALTRAKLDAARDLAIGVVMIGRPALPNRIDTVDGVEQVLDWVDRVVSRGSAEG